MNITRKTRILEGAMRKSNRLIEALAAELSKHSKNSSGDAPALIRNNELIRDACMSLLSRRSPEYPSAGAISEECGLLSKKPPSPRSIYNRHSEIRGIWRNAYQKIFDRMSVAHEDPAGSFESWDKSHLSHDDRNFFDDLIRSIHSVRHKNNLLRQYIAENIPLGRDEPASDGEFLDELKNFLESLTISGFELDDLALRTTRRVPAGTIVMERTLFDRLRGLVEIRTKTSAAQQLLQVSQ